MQTLEDLQPDTPYFLLLRADNTSEVQPQDVMPIESLLGLLAYTFVLPTPSHISQVSSSSRNSRRLLTDNSGGSGNVTVISESAQEALVAAVLPEEHIGYPGLHEVANPKAPWNADLSATAPQCRNVSVESQTSEGAGTGTAEAASSLSAADAVHVQTGDDAALLFGPVMFPKRTTVGLRLDVWPKAARDFDAAESRIMSARVQDVRITSACQHRMLPEKTSDLSHDFKLTFQSCCTLASLDHAAGCRHAPGHGMLETIHHDTPSLKCTR